MGTNGHNTGALPKLNVSMSERERARLERLAGLRGAKPSRVLAEAVIHMLATIEDGEPVRYVVPSERAERESQ